MSSLVLESLVNEHSSLRWCERISWSLWCCLFSIYFSNVRFHRLVIAKKLDYYPVSWIKCYQCCPLLVERRSYLAGFWFFTEFDQINEACLNKYLICFVGINSSTSCLAFGGHKKEGVKLMIFNYITGYWSTSVTVGLETTQGSRLKLWRMWLIQCCTYHHVLFPLFFLMAVCWTSLHADETSKWHNSLWNS